MQSSAVHVTISHNSVAPGKVSTNFCNFHKQIKRRVFARRFFVFFLYEVMQIKQTVQISKQLWNKTLSPIHQR